MLIASSADVAVGWIWHTAYRARWHWKLKREGALIAAAVVALAGAVDTARTLHRDPQAQAPAIATLTAPVSASTTPDTTAVATTITVPAAGAAPLAAAGGTQTAQAPATTPTFPIIQDQTGSIDQNDPIETILPMDSASRKDDPIAQKINERFGDAAPAEPAPRKAKARPVRTASAKPVRPPRPPRKPSGNDTTD